LSTFSPAGSAVAVMARARAVKRWENCMLVGGGGWA
jgi:hypothetical protein